MILRFPNLDIIIPAIDDTEKDIIIKGSRAFPAATASPPNPNGFGLLTNIGIL